MVIGELCPPTPTQPGWTASQFEGSQGRERRPGWTSPRVERQMTKCHSCCSPEMKMLNLPQRQFWLTWRFMRTSGAIQRTGSPPEVLFSSSTEAYREWESPKSETFATVPFWASRMFLWVGWDLRSGHNTFLLIWWLGYYLAARSPCTILCCSRNSIPRLTCHSKIFTETGQKHLSYLIAIFHKEFAVQLSRLRYDLKLC